MKIRKAGIIIKKGSAKPRRISGEIIEWFGARGIDTVTDSVTKDLDILIILSSSCPSSCWLRVP